MQDGTYKESHKLNTDLINMTKSVINGIHL